MTNTKDKTTKAVRSVLITGASSGLGRALALEYATNGVTLFLGGRDKDRLKETRKACEEKGAKAYDHALDVLDQLGMQSWIKRSHEIAPLDLVIANAGISAGTAGDMGETQRQAQQIFAVNVYGVNNTLYPALPLMNERGKGQMAIVSSMAGFYGFPGAPAYCASKAAVRVMGEAWRADHRANNIRVNVICPGYIKTNMTDANGFPMPFMWTAEKAAKHIRKNLARNKARISFPWGLRFALWMLTNLPASLVDWMLSKSPGKPAMDFDD